MSARYASSYCVLNELKKGLEYMASIIAASMVCFPYVIAGLGQAIIVGTHSAGRTVRDTAEEIKGQKVPFMTSNEIVQASRKEETRCKVCFIPGCAVFAPR